MKNGYILVLQEDCGNVFPNSAVWINVTLHFLVHCSMEVSYRARHYMENRLGTNKAVLFWDLSTAVVGMWQAKTQTRLKGLSSDSGVFDFLLESQTIRERVGLRNCRVQFYYSIGVETEASWKEVPCLCELEEVVVVVVVVVVCVHLCVCVSEKEQLKGKFCSYLPKIMSQDEAAGDFAVFLISLRDTSGSILRVASEIPIFKCSFYT